MIGRRSVGYRRDPDLCCFCVAAAGPVSQRASAAGPGASARGSKTGRRQLPIGLSASRVLLRPGQEGRTVTSGVCMQQPQPTQIAAYALPVDADFAATERHRTARSVSLGMDGSPGWLLADRPRLDSSQGLGEARSIAGAAQGAVLMAADAG